MEVITFILTVVILIVIVRQRSVIRELNSKMDTLIRRQKLFEQNSEKNMTTNEPIKNEFQKDADTPSEAKTDYFEQKPIILSHKEESEPIISEQNPINSYFNESISQPIPKVEKPPRLSFMERNPDLEKFIGENLLSKIGIVIFVIGMGFLVKLGIDNNVITESMRIGIGLLIGGGMVALAHYLRKSFIAFSSILIGGALSVLYFTIALAFHQYALIPQTAAFIAMVLITCFGVLLSITYNNKVLAILAVLGGFGTPFFLSTGEGNVSALFTYLLILDIGMLILVYTKKWNIVNLLAYIFTYLIYIGVYFDKYLSNQDELRLTLFLFLSSIYLIFFLMNIIYNVKNNCQFKAKEILMLLSNSGLYFTFGLSIVSDYKEGVFSGLFTAMVAIFNFVFAYLLYKRKGIDKNLLFLLIGLVLTFVSLVAPIQLKGNYITLFWAFEAVLLLWLANKSRLNIIKKTSIIVTGLMLVSLVMDWQYNYTPYGEFIVLNIIVNKVFITGFFAGLSIFLSIKLWQKDEVMSIGALSFPFKKIYFQVLFLALIYFVPLFEFNYQLVRFEYSDPFRIILLGVYNYLFVIGLIQLSQVKSIAIFTRVVSIFSGVVILSYMSFFLIQITRARNIINDLAGFYWHYVLLLSVALITINLVKRQLAFYGQKSSVTKLIWGAVSFVAVYILSAEVGHLSVLYQNGSGLSTSEAYSVALKSVYPVVWAISALVLMIVGMKYRIKTMRLASLVLFSITIVKLFVYDLAGNSTGKIISFILLGAILLLISFLYQKLKFIIQDDEDDKNN